MRGIGDAVSLHCTANRQIGRITLIDPKPHTETRARAISIDLTVPDVYKGVVETIRKAKETNTRVLISL